MDCLVFALCRFSCGRNAWFSVIFDDALLMFCCLGYLFPLMVKTNGMQSSSRNDVFFDVLNNARKSVTFKNKMGVRLHEVVVDGLDQYIVCLSQISVSEFW